MSASGPNNVPTTDAAGLTMTVQAVNVTVGAADIVLSSLFNCGYCRRVVCNAAGNVFVQRSKDTAPAEYAAIQGQAIDGNIVLIGGSTNHPGASAIQLVLEA